MSCNSEEDTNPKTILDIFHETSVKYSNEPALYYKKDSFDAWSFITWDEYWQASRKFSKSLIHLGIDMFRIINILGFNSPEWFISNCGAVMAGIIPAGIYLTNSAEACHYITEHTEAELICVDGNSQLEKYSTRNFANLKAIVIWNGDPDSNLVGKFNVPIYRWNEFLILGDSVADSVVENRASQINHRNCAVIIYTSGTTGLPKGVMLSHDNITWTIKQFFESSLRVTFADRFISYLPLSHIAAQMVDIYGPMKVGAKTYFAQPDGLKGSLFTTMKQVRPTIFFAVPRVWEKIKEAFEKKLQTLNILQRWVIQWSKNIGLQHNKYKQCGEKKRDDIRFSIANFIALSSIKKSFGLDQAHSCFTAASPIDKETLWFFASIDIPIYEVYGQAESSGPHSVSRESAWKIGYCGVPLPNSITRISDNNGEILCGGRHIFLGYLKMRDKTAEVIDSDGYLRTGDIGKLVEIHDPNIDKTYQFLQINGRLKELLITSGGENISPTLIENEVKSMITVLSNCVVIGDKRNYLSMLISLKAEIDKESGDVTDILTPEGKLLSLKLGSKSELVSQAINDPLWENYIEDNLKLINKNVISSAHTMIRKWRWLPKDLTEKSGELTPTFKIKRNYVIEKYSQLINSMYNN